jgi:membrane associated rhomboid family serine protease
MTTWQSLFVASTRTSPSYDWGLVPARGWAQPGWITAMFLHGSWLHLIGNFIFFAVVGPALEELLSPLVFLGFYLLGGVIAGLGQVLVNPHSEIPMIGASGAIAACMGAFTLRFASDQVRLIFFRGFAPRIVEWPAWVWAGLWVFEQLLMVLLHGVSGGGVALFAHLSGFAFGMAAAGLMRVTGWGGGLEARAPPEESSGEPRDALSQADALADRHDLPGAIRVYRNLLRSEPDNIPAKWGLARILFQTGETTEASRLFNEVLRKWLEGGRTNQFLIKQAVGAVGRQLDPRELSPDCARAIAPYLESIDQALAVTAYDIAARG